MNAVDGKPKGAKAFSKLRMASMLTGSEPMIITALPRSIPAPSFGTPRCAVYS
ncbi:Uncharacterised protein [Mycobacteroides abscessus subsp. abscessus]|nr:Uncharacterised protein [Mycobacteroides abscessus subsp. abscessus]SKV03147.1 Uncharacterised protein [Mycobacteroides abscessus subsp. abscessus]